jgi:predicted NAD/FAD-dependent oxidoreductase
MEPASRPVRLSEGLYVAGDHRESPSIQGALVAGRRAAEALIAESERRGTIA